MHKYQQWAGMEYKRYDVQHTQVANSVLTINNHILSSTNSNIMHAAYHHTFPLILSQPIAVTGLRSQSLYCSIHT